MNGFAMTGVRSALLIPVVSVAACRPASNEMIDSTLSAPATSMSSGATARALRALAGRRIYFAHQSVGGNLVSGVESLLRAEGGAGLRIVETHHPAAVAGPAFIHFKAGRNEDPKSKNADFVRVLDARARADSGIALMKYCFLDVNLQTDVDAMFGEYRSMVNDLRARHPDLTFVHVTMPLTTDQTGIKAGIKRLIGRPTTRDVNARRGRFNELLRKEFAHDPIFDLATLEATHADGSLERGTLGDRDVISLAPENTNDGGHLSTDAERRFAERFVTMLAAIPHAATR